MRHSRYRLGIRLQVMGSCVVAAAACIAVAARGSISSGSVGLSVSYAITLTGWLNGLIQCFTGSEQNLVGGCCPR